MFQSEAVAVSRMAPLVLSHSLRLGPLFNRDEYCDAVLTKDGERLIPVHRNILASVSTKFKRMFETSDLREGLGAYVVVPVVDFDALKKVVDYIYDGKTEFGELDDYDNFRDALAMLKVEVKQEVQRKASPGPGAEAAASPDGSLGGARRELSVLREAALQSVRLPDGPAAPRERLPTIELPEEETTGRGSPRSPARKRTKWDEWQLGGLKKAVAPHLQRSILPCRNFERRGYCRYGTNCLFLHDSDPTFHSLHVLDESETVQTVQLERYFARYGEIVWVQYITTGPGGSEFKVRVKAKDQARSKKLRRSVHKIEGVRVAVDDLGSRLAGRIRKPNQTSGSRLAGRKRSRSRSRGREPARRLPKLGYRRLPGDWDCARCGAKRGIFICSRSCGNRGNYADRSTCYRCPEPRPLEANFVKAKGTDLRLLAKAEGPDLRDRLRSGRDLRTGAEGRRRAARGKMGPPGGLHFPSHAWLVEMKHAPGLA
jgi:hypothetical protein